LRRASLLTLVAGMTVLLIIALGVVLLRSESRGGRIEEVAGSEVLPSATPVSPTASPAIQTPVSAVPNSDDSCRNSFDPACGDFQWDPKPVNDPMLVKVEASDQSPGVGELIEFVVTVEDDALKKPRESYRTYGERTGGSNTVSCKSQPRRYGSWTPPPKGDQSVSERFEHAYSQPGEYKAVFEYSTTQCNRYDPYASVGEGTIIIRVE
jgi:hypothetical protein